MLRTYVVNGIVVTVATAVVLATFSLLVRNNPRLRRHLATTPLTLVCGIAGAVTLVVTLMILAVLIAVLLVAVTVTAWFPLDLTIE